MSDRRTAGCSTVENFDQALYDYSSCPGRMQRSRRRIEERSSVGKARFVQALHNIYIMSRKDATIWSTIKERSSANTIVCSILARHTHPVRKRCNNFNPTAAEFSFSKNKLQCNHQYWYIGHTFNHGGWNSKLQIWPAVATKPELSDVDETETWPTCTPTYLLNLGTLPPLQKAMTPALTCPSGTFPPLTPSK